MNGVLDIVLHSMNKACCACLTNVELQKSLSIHFAKAPLFPSSIFHGAVRNLRD